MASIVQSPAPLNLQGVASSPFNLTLNITLKDENGDTIAWSDPGEFIGFVQGLPTWSPNQLVEVDSLEPTITSPEDNVVTVAWGVDQTQALSQVSSASWAFLMTFSDEGGPFPLLGGSIAMSSPTTPGSSTGTTESLTVNIGNITATVNVTIGGAGGGGATITDIGGVEIVLLNATGDSFDSPGIIVAPSHTDGESTGLVRGYPPNATDFTPLQALSPGQEIDVVAFSELAPSLWDTVDAFVEVVVWDQAGENVLVASGGAGGLTSDSEPTPMKLSVTQVIGSDLSVVDPGVIQTASGGSYNLLIKGGVEWD